LIATAAWSGPRQGEILGLQWGDIDFAGRLIEVRRTVGYGNGALRTGSPKSGRARRVDLPDLRSGWLMARKSLQEAEAALQGRDRTPWVFSQPSWAPLEA
jgi:integrase